MAPWVFRTKPGISGHAAGYPRAGSRSTVAGRRARAFTLVELILVLTVLAITSAVALPSFVRFLRRSQFAEAARKTASLAAEARGLAVSRDATVSLAYDTGAHALRLDVEPSETDADAELADPAPPPAAESAAPEARGLEYPSEVRLEIVRLEIDGARARSALRFYGDGTADPAIVRLERDGLDPIVLAVNPRTGRLAATEERP